MRNLDLWRGSLTPLREMSGLNRLMGRVLEDWPADGVLVDANKYGFDPTCEVTEDDRAFYLKADLPGVKKDDIKIDLHDNRLTLAGERTVEKKTDAADQRIHFSEVFYGSFSRAIEFPTKVDAERAEAKYENGVLNLTIPKVATTSARQISVK